MEQLLDIIHIPLSFEMKVHNAKLEISDDNFFQQGIVDFTDLTPYTPRLYFDTREYKYKARSTAGHQTGPVSYEDQILMSMSGTADLAKEEKSLMETQDSTSTLSAFTFQHIQPTIQSTIGIPAYPADFDWDTQSLSVQYETDRQNYEWLTKNRPKLKFTPASVEFVVKEYARVEFKYLGKPQYVPPSASPDYQPPKMNVTA